jgi:hypothetical protein
VAFGDGGEGERMGGEGSEKGCVGRAEMRDVEEEMRCCDAWVEEPLGDGESRGERGCGSLAAIGD